MGRRRAIPHSRRQLHLLSLTHHRLLRDQCTLRRMSVLPVVPDPVFGQDTMATNMLRVNYMKKMRPFYGNKPPRDEKQRAWEEYLSEFVQNAETCRLPQDQYQNIAELMLAPEVRDQWMQAKASMNCNSWEGFNNYMSTHYAALDKSVEAERKFSNNVLTHETERAWQMYSLTQARHVTDMGAPGKRPVSDIGLWAIFLKNIPQTLSIHNFAFNLNYQHQKEWEKLDVQQRILKITPLVLDYIKTKNIFLGTKPAAVAGPRSPSASTGQASSKRQLHHPYTPNRTQRPRQAVGPPNRPDSIQPETFNRYTAVPTDTDYKQCPDVGFHDKTEPRPYNHSLNSQLQAARRCLVCWSAEHGICQLPQQEQVNDQ